jgi:DNA-binding transcriptional ArsR family regulator
VDAALRALAEPTRRRILRLVRDRERTAGDIAGHFAVTRPAVSQHLRALEDAQLVTVRRDGTRRWYRARPEGLNEMQAWLATMWRGNLADLKRAAEREERGGRARRPVRARAKSRARDRA